MQAAGRAVRNDRASGLTEHVIQTEYQRKLLADVATGFINHRQTICVRILTETDHRSRFHDAGPHAGQVLGGWFRSVFELPVRLATEQRNLATKRFQQLPSQDAAGTVIRIE